MKKITIALSLLASLTAVSQSSETIYQSQYDRLKSSGLLNTTTQYNLVPDIIHQPESNPSFLKRTSSTSYSCSCLLAVNNTYSLVPFSPAVSSNFRTDDGSSPAIHLPFNFNYYGTTYDTVYINTNGNISFKQKISSFSSNGFPAGSVASPETLMVAPFWADVDTRNLVSGLVYYKITPTAMIVKWDSVGYYNSMASLRNTFQLIITNGQDPILSNGDNVAFCYGDMQWTTGDGSNGINGLGGIPATVGVNKGDGVNYFQIGRFNLAGSIFDGPYNNTDGVDFLDNQSIYFNTTNSVNIPPIIINNDICDTIDVFTGDTLFLKSMAADTAFVRMTILAGEQNQDVNVSFSSDATANFSSLQHINLPGYKSYTLKFFKGTLPSGYYHIYVNSADNGIPVRSTNRTIVLKIKGTEPTNTALEDYHQDSYSIYPNPTTGLLSIQTTNSSHATILNIFGQIVSSFSISKGKQDIDISEFGAGIYFLQIGNEKVVKIIKQ